MNLLSELHRIRNLYTVPEFVKTANYEESASTDALSLSQFADGKAREYPVHTKLACFLSNIRFWERASDESAADHFTGEKLLKFAEFWKCADDLRDVLLQMRAAHTKTASADCYALHVDQVAYFPLANADQVEKSAAAFYSTRATLPLGMRKEAASNILRKAAELKVAIDDPAITALEQSAGCGLSSKAQVAVGFTKRAELLRGTKHQGAVAMVEKLASAAATADVSRDFLDRTARVFDELDTFTGLYKHYADGSLELPEETCYATLTKEAAEAMDAQVVLVTGSAFNKSDLEKAGLAPFQVLPDYLAEISTGKALDMTKAADVMPTMPRDDALLLERALSAAGVEKAANYTPRQVGLMTFIKTSALDWSRWDKKSAGVVEMPFEEGIHGQLEKRNKADPKVLKFHKGLFS